jgi:hypothetical protein
MSPSPEQSQKFANEFWMRFEHFRRIEVEQIVGPFRYSHEAFALLRDAELCYAAKAYFASIVMAHSIIEIHLKKAEGLTGTASELFKKAGITEEVDWLRKLRNDIIHGNSSSQVTYGINEDLATVWEQYCLRAFEFMHALPIRLYRASTNG